MLVHFTGCYKVDLALPAFLRSVDWKWHVNRQYYGLASVGALGLCLRYVVDIRIRCGTLKSSLLYNVPFILPLRRFD